MLFAGRWPETVDYGRKDYQENSDQTQRSWCQKKEVVGSDCQERDTKGKKTIKSNALAMTFLETSAVFSLAFENKPSILFIVKDIVWFINLNFFSYLSNSQM